MSRIRLAIQEELKFDKKMVIEVPDNLDEEDFNKILDIAERRAYASGDVPGLLLEINDEIKIIEYPDTDYSSPRDAEIEIYDYNDIKDDE